jgi:hypothetical protein
MAYTPDTLATIGQTGQMLRSAPATNPSVMRYWTYKSEDAMATIRAAGYISDAASRNMSVGDVVFAETTVAGVPSTLYITAVMAITSGAADLADGTSITLTNT